MHRKASQNHRITQFIRELNVGKKRELYHEKENVDQIQKKDSN